MGVWALCQYVGAWFSFCLTISLGIIYRSQISLRGQAVACVWNLVQCVCLSFFSSNFILTLGKEATTTHADFILILIWYWDSDRQTLTTFVGFAILSLHTIKTNHTYRFSDLINPKQISYMILGQKHKKEMNALNFYQYLEQSLKQHQTLPVVSQLQI